MRLAEEKLVGISGIVGENDGMGRWIVILLCAAVAEASTDVERLLDIRRWIVAQEGGESVLPPPPQTIGKVISCIGQCQVLRGTVGHGVRWLSRIEEGDEIHTGPRSYLWLMLIDGTLVRLAAETRVALLAVGGTTQRIFFQARLAQGQLYWLPRSLGEVPPQMAPETDQLFLPLMDAGANLATFRRAEYLRRDEAGRAAFWEARETPGLAAQYGELNRLIKENNSFWKLPHEALVVAPNATVHTFGQPLLLFHQVAGPSWFKLFGATGATANFYFRGYENSKVEQPSADQWWWVDPAGRELQAPPETPGLLSASELVLRRIPSLLLLRERWLAAARPLWQRIHSALLLVLKERIPIVVANGARLSPDGAERIAFLKEHTRRLETTNLRSLQRLHGEPGPGFDGRHFADALDAYFHHLKTAQSHSLTSVVDMSPLHYYGWMLINARQNR